MRAADPTAWDARITQVMQRDSVSKTEAMVRARLEWPGEFQAWNQVNAAAPNTEQQTRRNYPSTNVGKSAPTCWEEHVADHMARYQVSERLAKVRLANPTSSFLQTDSFVFNEIGHPLVTIRVDTCVLRLNKMRVGTKITPAEIAPTENESPRERTYPLRITDRSKYSSKKHVTFSHYFG